MGRHIRATNVAIIGLALVGILTRFYYSPFSTAPQYSAALPITLAWYLSLIAISVVALAGVGQRAASRLSFGVICLGLPIVALHGYVALSSRRLPSIRDGIGDLIVWGLFVVIAVSGDRAAPCYGPGRLYKTSRKVAVWAVACTTVAIMTVLGTMAAREAYTIEWLRGQPFTNSSAVGEALVTVSVFSDFQCPACRARRLVYDPIIAEVAAEHPGQVVFQHFDFPLNSDCNTGVSGTLHPAACAEAVAVRVARSRGLDARVGTYFYDHQSDIDDPAIVRSVMRDQGFGEVFDQEYSQELQRVKEDARFGVHLGVKATPTYFVDGLEVSAWSPELLRRALEWRVMHSNRMLKKGSSPI